MLIIGELMCAYINLLLIKLTIARRKSLYDKMIRKMCVQYCVNETRLTLFYHFTVLK